MTHRPVVVTALAGLLLAPLAGAQDAPAPAAEPAMTEPAEPTPAPKPPSTTYTIGQSGSDLYVVIRNDTNKTLSRLGHDHVIYASQFNGTVTWPNEDGAGCNISFSVPVLKLTVDPPGLRGKAGLDDNTIDDGDKKSLSNNMWGKSQLHASSFPDVTFTSTSCSGREGTVDVTGNLTIRGVTKQITVPMAVTADGKSFSARGKFDTTHTAFGFSPFAASAFGPKNQDRLTFVVRVRGNAQ